jgi:molybdopterin/thiamine biosynthesis adenylyltransferase/rhodanese-related sulfurtransferase
LTEDAVLMSIGMENFACFSDKRDENQLSEVLIFQIQYYCNFGGSKARGDMFSQRELLRYSRQFVLPGMGLEGQQKLKQGSILVIGAGGLGSPALLYLAAAGIGRIGIVEFDTVDESNLQRQILYSTEDVGKPKVLKAQERLHHLNAHVSTDIHHCVLNTQNAMDIISGYDVVIDGSDNLPTRYLVNDACVFLNKTLIYGAVFQFEGQASVFNQQFANGARGPNYRDLFPEPPPPEMVPSCNVGGVLGVLPGIIGTIQANEAIKVIAGIGKTLSGRLMMFDSLDFTIRFLNLKPNPDNPVSGINPTIRTLINYEEFCNPAHAKGELKEITPSKVKMLLEDGTRIQLIDVREPVEHALANIGGLNLPLNSIEENVDQFEKDARIILYCKSGQRSAQAIRRLQKRYGLTNLAHMKGGLTAWKTEVDGKLNLY